MGWLIVGVWVGAVVFACLVVGFCAYELIGKRRRLRAHLDRLAAVSSAVSALQVDVEATRVRLLETRR